MTTINRNIWFSILDAFDFLGRRKHATKWVGRETKSVPKRTPKPRSDMEHAVPDLSDDEIVRRLRADKGELGGLKWADTWAELYGPALRESMGRDPEGWFLEKPEMEPERKVHREAEAEWLSRPEETWEKIKKGFWQSHWPPDPDSKEYLEAREAWERREDTIAALRTIMSEHGIGSFLLIAGREVRLESLQWDPDNMAFEIDLLTEVCGEGKQKGPTYIEREPFIAVVDQFYPIPSALDRQARSEGGKAEKYYKGFQNLADFVRDDLGKKLTQGKFLGYLRKQIAEFKDESSDGQSWSPPIKGCDDIKVDSDDTVYWEEDGTDQARTRSLKSGALKPYIGRANKRY